MSVYKELMKEDELAGARRAAARTTPELEAEKARLRAEFAEARRKKAAAAAKPQTKKDHTEYEGPSLREKLARLKEETPAETRRRAFLAVQKQRGSGVSMKRGLPGGSTTEPTVVAHTEYEGPSLAELTKFGAEVIARGKGAVRRMETARGVPPSQRSGSLRGTPKKKSRTGKPEGPSLGEMLARLKEEEYTPTKRPKPSRVGQQIAPSVKSSGWFKRKSRVSGQTQLARVRPHEDPTSLSRPHTRAVSWAKSKPTKKDPKGTLTVAHTEYEGPSLREKLQYLMDQTGKTAPSKLPREKKSKIMAKWLSKRGASKSKPAPGSVTGFTQQQQTTTTGGEPATATHTPKKGEKGGGGTSPFARRTRIQIRPGEGPSTGAVTKKKPHATKF